MFEFNLNTKVYFGIGSRSKLIDILAENVWERIGVVIDHNVMNNAAVKDLIISLEEYSKELVIEQCTVSEPSYDYLDKIRTRFESGLFQVIIGIGGGSTIDTAKAIAVLINNKLPAIQYRGFDRMTNQVLPIIAIPTTAGTGSEVTPNASFIDLKGKRKMGINGESIRPKYAILDPEFTLTCPPNPTISVAVDSIVHAVEAFVAKKANPLACLFAREGFKLVITNLQQVVKDPLNLVCREKVMYGAFLSGVALMNSGTGPAAAMSYPLGVHYKVPHGIGGGIFLPYVIEYNIENGYYGYDGLYFVQDDWSEIMSRYEKSMAVLKEIKDVWNILSVPCDLRMVGFDESFIPQFIGETMELSGALKQNPLLFEENQIIEVLGKLKINRTYTDELKNSNMRCLTI